MKWVSVSAVIFAVLGGALLLAGMPESLILAAFGLAIAATTVYLVLGPRGLRSHRGRSATPSSMRQQPGRTADQDWDALQARRVASRRKHSGDGLKEGSGAPALLPAERSALEACLHGEHPTLALLREQLRSCTASARRYSGVGYFVDLVPSPEGPVADLPGTVTIRDTNGACAELEHGVGFILTIEGGRMVHLEAYTYVGPWPADEPQFEFSYRATPRELPF